MNDFTGGISPIQGPGSGGPDKITGGGSIGETDKSFNDLLKEQIGKVDQLQKEAGLAIESLAMGNTDNVTEVMAAVEKAGIAFKMLMQIRNKLMDAYREVSRMQV